MAFICTFCRQNISGYRFISYYYSFPLWNVWSEFGDRIYTYRSHVCRIDIKHFILFHFFVNHLSDLVWNLICGYRKVWYSYQISHSNTIKFYIGVFKWIFGDLPKNILNFIDKSMNIKFCHSRKSASGICWLAQFHSLFIVTDRLSSLRSLNSLMHVGFKMRVGQMLWVGPILRIMHFWSMNGFGVCCRWI